MPTDLAQLQVQFKRYANRLLTDESDPTLIAPAEFEQFLTEIETQAVIKKGFPLYSSYGPYAVVDPPAIANGNPQVELILVYCPTPFKYRVGPNGEWLTAKGLVVTSPNGALLANTNIMAAGPDYNPQGPNNPVPAQAGTDIPFCTGLAVLTKV